MEAKNEQSLEVLTALVDGSIGGRDEQELEQVAAAG
jgi:hypothetical protein